MATAPPPLPVVRAEGAWLELADGRKVFDGISSWWVTLHGHNHPRLRRAMVSQSEKLSQVIFAGLTHEPASRLAAELVRRTPCGLNRVFFSDDGSTAVEVALKMAYQQWRHRGEPQRTLFLALEGAYHGDTFGAMAAGGVAVFHQAFSELFFRVRRVSGAAELDQALEEEGERVAALILEPMLQGAAGMRIWPAEFLRHAREATRKRGIPLIADEVFTGFGRTGKLFACDHGPIEPDLLCLSKALTGGMLPLAVTLATEDVYSAFLSTDRSKTFFHGHSFTANALACAVALESLAVFDEERGLERVARLGATYARRLPELAGLPRVQSVRHLGAVAAFDVRSDGEGGYLDTLGPRLAAWLLERGLLLRPLGNVVYVLPPLAATDEEVERIFDLLAEALCALD